MKAVMMAKDNQGRFVVLLTKKGKDVVKAFKTPEEAAAVLKHPNLKTKEVS